MGLADIDTLGAGIGLHGGQEALYLITIDTHNSPCITIAYMWIAPPPPRHGGQGLQVMCKCHYITTTIRFCT
jgi:hypothetical protein